MTPLFQGLPPYWPGDNFWLHWLVFTVIIIAFVLSFVMGFIYIERRGIGRFQARLGPNRTGPFGLLQAVADAVKVLLKEDIVPKNADHIVHMLAPMVSFVPAMLLFAVVPFTEGRGGLLADLDIGILFVISISSISAMGVFMAGWASSNKYSLIGAMRSVAAVVSYEIPVVLSITGVIVLAGSLSMNTIVDRQTVPFILFQPLGFLLFFIGGCAEINRSPFDLMEADSEIVAGFHTEYSGIKFAMFYLVEYAEALAVSAVIATLFLGGWRGPVLPPFVWFVVKVLAVFFAMVWTRATMPRVRIDQLMALSWKFLFPLALINLVLTAIQVLVWRDGPPLFLIAVNFAIAFILVVVWSKKSYKVGLAKSEV